MHFFKNKNINIQNLYNKIVILTRKNFFYKDFGLNDTFSNRIYLTFFHFSFILIVLKEKENKKEINQNMFDFFMQQIELNMREIGYGDVTVNKNMKKLINLFYEILINCKKWYFNDLLKKDEFLLKFFTKKPSQKINVEKTIDYFDKFAFFIKDIPLNLLSKGVFEFEYKT